MNYLFTVPYKRPNSFSDPHRDFTSDCIRKVLSVPDSKMGREEYSCIFQGYLPIGTYEEVVYFLPYVLDSIYQSKNTMDISEYIEGVYIWLANNIESLRNDGILESCFNYMKYCFENWTSTFIIENIKKCECVHTRLKFSAVFNWTIECMIKYNVFSQLALSVIKSLIRTSNDPIRSAWFLDYAAAFKLDSYGSSQVIGDSEIYNSVTDKKELALHAAVVRNAIKEFKEIADFQQHSEYWKNIFRVLDLRGN